MSDLVGNPEDRFSHVAAHLFSGSRLWRMHIEENKSYLLRGGTGTLVDYCKAK